MSEDARHIGRKQVAIDIKGRVTRSSLYAGARGRYHSMRRRAAALSMRLMVYRNRLGRRLVLEVTYGGLGDHLFYSHLPRIAKESGSYDHVYISNRSVFRNEEIRGLVWELNPYIDGFIDEPGTFLLMKEIGQGRNLLDENMLFHLLDDGKRIHEPEIYLKPSIRQELTDKILYDPNYASNAGDLIRPEMVEDFFARNSLRVDMQMNLLDKHVAISRFGCWLSASSLREFCDIIYSCNHVYCLASGTATLSAALGKAATVFYHSGVKRDFLHSRSNEYIRLDSDDPRL